MAKQAAKKASNTFVWIILILLMFGLAGFGVTNFGGTVRSVATVGKTEVGIEEYGRALQVELQQLSQTMGQTVTMTQAQAMGLDRQVLQRMLGQAALDEAARTAGLSVGDAEVGQQISAIPAFSGPDGQFDRQAYSFMLDRNGMTPAQFEDQIRAELARNLLQVALIGGLSPGPAFGDAVYRYLAQTRSASVVALDVSVLAEPLSPPSEEEIAAYYDATPEAFTLPARKAITYVWLTPEMLAPTIEIPEADLRAAYEARHTEFSQPERRMVDRLGFADTAAAQEAADAIAAGTRSFDDFLADRGLTENDVDMGIVTQRDLGEAGLEVFALGDPGVAGPLPSSVGPALYRVNAILSATETPFEAARDGIHTDLAQNQARGLINDNYVTLDDMLAAGATLEDLAQESDMELGTLDWSATTTEGPAGFAAFANAAAAVTADDFPEIGHLDNGGIFALRLDRDIPAALQPLDAVRVQATEGAARDKRNAALIRRAEALITEIETGTALADLGLDVAVYDAFSRNAPPRDLPAPVLEAAFAMAPGALQLVETPDGPVLIQLTAVTDPDLTGDEAARIRDTVTAQAARGMAEDVLTGVARSVEATDGITTNDAALNAVHTQLP
ncbi:MAG: SurA N-terminal domain-containing protein [Qingshengfaniella sp.]